MERVCVWGVGRGIYCIHSPSDDGYNSVKLSKLQVHVSPGGMPESPKKLARSPAPPPPPALFLSAFFSAPLSFFLSLRPGMLRDPRGGERREWRGGSGERGERRGGKRREWRGGSGERGERRGGKRRGGKRRGRKRRGGEAEREGRGESGEKKVGHLIVSCEITTVPVHPLYITDVLILLISTV